MFERMRFRKGLAATVAGLLVALGAGGVAVAQSGGSSPSSVAPTQQSSVADPDTIQSGDQSAPDTAAEAAEPNEQAETPGAEHESKAEKANDDGPGGHADEPASPNADHQFQGVE